MIMIISAFISLLSFRFRSRAGLELELVALRHQVAVLRRQRKGWIQLFPADRLLWVWLYRIWPQAFNTVRPRYWFLLMKCRYPLSPSNFCAYFLKRVVNIPLLDATKNLLFIGVRQTTLNWVEARKSCERQANIPVVVFAVGQADWRYNGHGSDRA
jgi:hypothetical protein